MTALLGGTLISMIPYRRPGLVLVPGMAPGSLVLALQRDLRALGYLRNGLDGHFGPATTAAVRALQHDLLFNGGRGRDGLAPVAMRELNGARGTALHGRAGDAVAACIEDAPDESRLPTLAPAGDPAA